MRYDIARASRDFVLCEIEHVASPRRPCSGEYSAGLQAEDAAADEVLQIFDELRKLLASGWPVDRHLGNPDVQAWTHKCRGAHAKTTYQILKPKPGFWRLYFLPPTASSAEITFLHAVRKKRWTRDTKDFQRCCDLAAKLDAGTYKRVALVVPRR